MNVRKIIRRGLPCYQLLLLLLSGMLLQAQNYPVKYLGIEQGLSNNSVMSIYQDEDGFMWFGTYDGLNRYDGYECRVYRNQIGDTTSLLSNTVYTIDGDSRRNLWVGGMKGACVYTPATGVFHALRYLPFQSKTPMLLHENVQKIETVDNGLVLVGTQQAGLLLFNENGYTGTQIPLITAAGTRLRYDVVATVAAANGDSAWVFVQQVGLCRYTRTAGTLQLVNGTVRQANCLKTAGNRNLWIGTNEGLLLYNTAGNTFSSGMLPGKNRVINLCEDRKGDVWIGTDDAGIFIMSKGVSKPLPNSTEGALPLTRSISVWGIYEDAAGRKWIGTLRGGVSMIDAAPDYFRKVVYRPGVKERPVDNFIFSFCEDENSNLWIGTDGAGLRYWNRAQNTFTNYTRNADGAGNLSSNFITSIVKDASGSVWASTWSGGINKIQPAARQVKHYSCFNTVTGLEEKNIWVMYEDKDKTLWASATNHGCLYRYNPGADQFELFDTTITDVQCLAETADGSFWGGNYSTLIRIDKKSRRHTVFSIGYTIRCILEDSRKNLWIGTQEGGLLLFNRATGSYRRYSMTNGLPGNTVLRILEDKKGDLWLSTYNGLSRFKYSEGRFRNYSYTDGLQSNQFSFNAALRLSTGELAFGGINGFNLFYPDSIHDQQQQQAILLNGLLVNNIPIEKNIGYVTEWNRDRVAALRLPFEQTTLLLNFVSLGYSGTDKLKYASYLEGWDKEWNYASNARQASYSRLHEGTYTFKVRVTDAYNNWGPEVSLLTITVLPPWYRSWWARLLYGIAAVALVYGYLRYARARERMKYEIKLAHLESVKEKEMAERQLSVFTNISHEFRTPLTLIINPLRNTIGKIENSVLQQELVTAHRNARRLLSLVDQLLLFRKADSGAETLRTGFIDLTALCNEVYLCFSQQAKVKNINYIFEGGDEVTTIYGDYEKIEIALFNLLSNAFKFTPDGGAIQLQLQGQEYGAAVSISDTGCGISPEDQVRIFDKFQKGTASGDAQMGFGIGLYLVKYFTTMHGGVVTCNSLPGQGTTFTLTLPKGQAPEEAPGTGAAATGKPALLAELMEEALPETEPVTTVPNEEGLVAEELVTGKKSVLIVDDNEEMRHYLLRLFAPGYLLYSAANAEEGLELANTHMPDIIISDVFMGGMNGVELCRQVKQSETLGHIPVILLTATTSEAVKLQGIEGGADDYITKPFDSDILLARVETILKNQNQLRRYFLDSITLREHTHKVPAEYQHFLKKCIAIIEENIENKEFTMKVFSRQMGISHSGLYTKVKAISGQSVTAFIRSVRLRRAALLMLTENLSVKEAAFRVGFADPKYFREQFVRIFEMTPSEYIKKYRHTFNQEFNTIQKREE